MQEDQPFRKSGVIRQFTTLCEIYHLQIRHLKVIAE